VKRKQHIKLKSQNAREKDKITGEWEKNAREKE
jgi:hypothetical protein